MATETPRISAVKVIPAALSPTGKQIVSTIELVPGPAAAPCSFQAVNDASIHGLLHVYMTCALSYTLALGGVVRAASTSAAGGADQTGGNNKTAGNQGDGEGAEDDTSLAAKVRAVLGQQPPQTAKQWLLVTTTEIATTDVPHHPASLPRPLDLCILPLQPIVLVLFHGEQPGAPAEPAVLPKTPRPIYIGAPPEGDVSIAGFYELTPASWSHIEGKLRTCASPAFNTAILRQSLDVCWQSLASASGASATLDDDDYVGVDLIAKVTVADKALAGTLLLQPAQDMATGVSGAAGGVGTDRSAIIAAAGAGSGRVHSSSGGLGFGAGAGLGAGARAHAEAFPFPRGQPQGDRLGGASTGADAAPHNGLGAAANSLSRLLADKGLLIGPCAAVGGGGVKRARGSVTAQAPVAAFDVDADDEAEGDIIDARTGLLVGDHFDGGSEDERDVDRGVSSEDEEDGDVDDDAEGSDDDDDIDSDNAGELDG